MSATSYTFFSISFPKTESKVFSSGDIFFSFSYILNINLNLLISIRIILLFLSIMALFRGLLLFSFLPVLKFSFPLTTALLLV